MELYELDKIFLMNFLKFLIEGMVEVGSVGGMAQVEEMEGLVMFLSLPDWIEGSRHLICHHAS